MGKKTNWTLAEDQTLCRAWLNASDLQLQSSDQKPASFWNVVRQLFHDEVETTVERPLTGLKIRWTRINRDVQKFAKLFAKVHDMTAAAGADAATAGGGGETGTAVTAAESVTEQQCIDEAKEQFFKTHATKFVFEGCWKQLRYSTKWLQLLANSTGIPVLSLSSTNPFLTADEMSGLGSSPSPQPVLPISSGPDVSNTAAVASTVVTAAAIAAAPSATDTNAFVSNVGRKRRATQPLTESAECRPLDQFYDITSSLVDEVKRRNELLEDQNAIALLRIDPDMIPDSEGRDCFQLLRTRYFKKQREGAETPRPGAFSSEANGVGHGDTGASSGLQDREHVV